MHTHEILALILFSVLSACAVFQYDDECTEGGTDTCVGCIDDCLEPMK